MRRRSPDTRPLLRKEIDPAFARRARLILEHLDAARGMQVLDLGCGRGFYAVATALLYPGITVTGIDFEQKHISYANRVLSTIPNINNVHFQTGDATHLQLRSGTVDRIICSEVLEHIPDDEQVIWEMYRVLKPGGIVLLSVPVRNYPFLWDPANFLLERMTGVHLPSRIWWLSGIWADHVRLYTDDVLLGKLSRSGFRIRRTWKATTWCMPAAHFLLYGIGKNLMERGFGGKGLNRFDLLAPPSRLTSVLRTIFLLFEGNNDALEQGNPRQYLNLVVQAQKP